MIRCTYLLLLLFFGQGLIAQTRPEIDFQIRQIDSLLDQDQFAALQLLLPKTKDQAEAIGYTGGLSDVYHYYAALYAADPEEENDKKILEYFQRSLLMARTAGDSSRVARALTNICTELYTGGSYSKAIETGHQAVEILETFLQRSDLSDTEHFVSTKRLAETYLTLSDAYGSFNDRSAISFALKGLSWHLKNRPPDHNLRDYAMIANANFSLGTLYFNFRESDPRYSDSADLYFKQALDFYQSSENWVSVVESHNALCSGALQSKDLSGASNHFNQAEAYLAQLTPEERFRPEWYFNLNKSQYLLKRDETAKALQLLRKIKEEQPGLFEAYNGTLYLAETFEKLGLKDSSSYYYQKVIAYKDSVFLRNQSGFYDVTLDYNNRINEKKVKLEQLNTQEARIRGKYYASGLLAALFLLLLLLLFVRFLRNKSRLNLEQYKGALQEAVAEGQFMFSSGQIEGQNIRLMQVYDALHHEYIPNLAEVKRQLEELKDVLPIGMESQVLAQEGFDLLKTTTAKLHGLSRELSPDNVHTKHSVSGATIQNLERLRDRFHKIGKTKIHLDISELYINERFALDIYRICNELIHNAVKHGPPSNIWVELEQNDKYLTLKVRDDGPGVKAHTMDQHGTGINAMRITVARYNGEGPFVTTGAGKGYELYFKFPLNDSDAI